MINFKGSRFEKEIILINVYWYLKYPLSYRDLEEMAKDSNKTHFLLGRTHFWDLKHQYLMSNVTIKR